MPTEVIICKCGALWGPFKAGVHQRHMLLPFAKYTTQIKSYLMPVNALVHADFLVSCIASFVLEWICKTHKVLKNSFCIPGRRHCRFKLVQKADRGLRDGGAEKGMNSSVLGSVRWQTTERGYLPASVPCPPAASAFDYWTPSQRGRKREKKERSGNNIDQCRFMFTVGRKHLRRKGTMKALNI